MKEEKFMNILKRVTFFGLLCFVQALYAHPEASSITTIQKAASENKYIFILFYKEKNEKTRQLQKVFDDNAYKLKEAKSISININNPDEKTTIERFKLLHSPMPFVIVLAPNGAITGGFSSFTPQQLVNSVISKGAASCLKALQERKLVLLCIQNKKTAHNRLTLQAANAFKKDPRFSNATEVVVIDPSDTHEYSFLNQLAINPHSSESTIALISPPATVIGKYQGYITKEQLVSNLKKATSGCCCKGGKCCSGCCNNQKEEVS